MRSGAAEIAILTVGCSKLVLVISIRTQDVPPMIFSLDLWVPSQTSSGIAPRSETEFLCWSLIGLEITSGKFAFITGPPGGVISTPAPTLEAPGLFLANVLLSGVGNGSAHVQLVRAGDVKFDATIDILPEPSSLSLAGVSMVVLSGIYRRAALGRRRGTL